MPELPEVETVRRALERGVVGRTIAGVRVQRRDVVVTERDPAGGFSRSRGDIEPRPTRVPGAWLLARDRVARVLRRGKQLALVGESGRVVCVHLGMSGRLLLTEAGDAGRAHDHVVWRLEAGGRLVFNDPRRFGGVWVLPSVDALHAGRWAVLGPDALEIDGEMLRELCRGTSRALKALLLDQAVIAGVGNIYCDEALAIAGLSPVDRAVGVGDEAWERLADAIRAVLDRAIEAGGSTLRDYTAPDNAPGGYQTQHRVYGRGGLPCLDCGGTLESALVAQRTTVWCPRCQPVSG